MYISHRTHFKKHKPPQTRRAWALMYLPSLFYHRKTLSTEAQPAKSLRGQELYTSSKFSWCSAHTSATKIHCICGGRGNGFQDHSWKTNICRCPKVLYKTVLLLKEVYAYPLKHLKPSLNHLYYQALCKH